MRIELKKPFSDIYKCGYLLTNKEPRKLVILYNNSKDRKTISFARYLMSVHLGYIVDKNFEVDHINNNKECDELENLQLLTKADNIRKSSKPTKYIERICEICGKNFMFENRNIKFHPNPTCSRKCGGIKSHITKRMS